MTDSKSPTLHADPAYLAALASLEQGRAETKPPDPAKCSIAVLPFDNMSGDPEQEYFADGIAEDLLTELSRHRRLAVVSRNSSFYYKGKPVNAQTAGRELGADFIVEGSVRKAGNRVRVTVQLIDCNSGMHAWAERYDRSIEDVFALQDEIVSTILGGLSFNLDEATAARRLRDPTVSSSAYSAFLQGRSAWRAGDEAAARSHLHRAIEFDPHYPPALAYLSFLYAYSRYSACSAASDAETLKMSEDLASRALDAGGDDAFVLHRLADVRLLNGRPLVARQLSEMARRLQPRDIETEFTFGLAQAFCGEHESGLRLMEEAIRREARLPAGYRAALADGYYLSRMHQKAVDIYDSFLEMPAYIVVLRAVSLAQLGRIEEARQAVTATTASTSDPLDLGQYARNIAAMCALPEDAEHWLDGFRKAGVDV